MISDILRIFSSALKGFDEDDNVQLDDVIDDAVSASHDAAYPQDDAAYPADDAVSACHEAAMGQSIGHLGLVLDADPTRCR